MRHNLTLARQWAGGALTFAVVKANAYGHGLSAALQGFADADGLALVEFDMAARLRAAGWSRPILMLEGAFDPDDLAQAVHDQLTVAVHDADQIRWIESLGPRSDLRVFVKLNSGMNRLGFTDDAFRRACARLSAAPAVRSVGLMTHFAAADIAGGEQVAQRRFERVCAGLPGPRSLANSAALIDAPSARADLVRPGILLYGSSPFADRSAAALGLRAAMSLRSAVIAVQDLAEGDALGYGATFRASSSMRVGIVACGYADGYPRHAPTGTPVLVDGVPTRTLGRVSMDMLAVDLTPVPAAGVGAPVELWGPALSIDAVASAAGTIGYELMCALAPRVPVVVTD